jgi:DNA-binding CsgD family transcriptional regulator
MPLESLLIYLFSLLAVVTGCWLALGLMKTFRLYFLSFFTGYLVAINIIELLNLVVGDLGPALLGAISPSGMRTVYILFGLVGFPLLAIGFYLYLAFIAGILDREMSPVFRGVYILFWMVLVAVFLVRVQLSLLQKYLWLSRTLGIAIGLCSSAVPLGALIYLAIQTRRGPRDKGKSGLRRFAVVSLIGFALYEAAFSLSQANPLLRWTFPACLLAANVWPVLTLKGFLSREGRPILPELFSHPSLERFRERFQLSAREGEILDLLLGGKSNKDIEKVLFISHHTVRNHIHNIYQKLEVSSRLQLMNLVRTWFDSAA